MMGEGHQEDVTQELDPQRLLGMYILLALLVGWWGDHVDGAD